MSVYNPRAPNTTQMFDLNDDFYVMVAWGYTYKGSVLNVRQNIWFHDLCVPGLGVGSIFRLRGHQKCKPQIEIRGRTLIK